MTTSSAAYVWIHLPGATAPTVAGRIRTDEAIGSFVYGQSYLDNAAALPFDPVELTLVSGERTFDAARHGGLPGALRDASPDGWGRYLLGAHQERAPDEVGLLLRSPDDRVGALSFSASVTEPPPAARQVTLEAIAALRAAAERQADERGARHGYGGLSTRSRGIMGQPGTSLGGARPKVTVLDDGVLWLAKVGTPTDRFDYPRVEAAMLDLAALCGIEAPRARVERFGETEALLVERFDRRALAGGAFGRIRFASALTCFEASEDDRGVGSYPELADLLRRVGRAGDGPELFRRMAFNALINNADDHLRNHGVLGDGEGWRLSPAYDLVPDPSASHEVRLALAIGEQGRVATADNLVSRSGRFGLGTDEARRVLQGMAAAVAANWEDALRRRGVPTGDLALLGNAFLKPGLGLAADGAGPPTPGAATPPGGNADGGAARRRPRP